jgi:hypothetical protein
MATEITWVPTVVWIGAEKFIVDEKKLAEPSYNSDLNSMPTIPSHIIPHTQAVLPRMPTFI